MDIDTVTNFLSGLDFAIVHPLVHEDVDILSDHVVLALSAFIGYIVLPNILIRLYMALIGDRWGGTSIGVMFLGVGIGKVIVIAIVWYWSTAEERTAAFPVHFPSTAEFGWTIVFLLLSVTVVPILGVEPFDYNLMDPTTAVGVLLGPILIAPFLEEALFRGLLLGSLIGRGWSPLVAGLGTIILFAVGHFWVGGVALAV